MARDIHDYDSLKEAYGDLLMFERFLGPVRSERVEDFLDLSARPGPAEVVANLDSGVPDGEVLYDVPALLRLQHFLHLLFSELLSINELQGLSLVRYLVEYLEVLLHARLFARVDDAVGRDVDDSVLDLRQRLHCRNEL